jgi:hypothetical protein
MSARSGIAKAMSEGIASKLNGTGDYVNNVYNNVTNKVKHFDDIRDYPYISITPGPEEREDMPSNFTWATLTMYIRIYVENNDDAQGELESLISDIETFLDLNLNITYTINTSEGLKSNKIVDNSILTITTDEGILDPNALGEVAISVRYEKLRKT